MRSNFGFIVPILIIVGIVLGGILVFVSRSYVVPSLLPPSNGTSSPLPSPDGKTIIDKLKDIGGWQTYNNSALGISIQYPNDWILNTKCEEYGAIFLGYSSETSGTCDIYFNPRDLKNTKINVGFGIVVIEKKSGSFDEARQELANDPKIKESFSDSSEVNVSGNPAIRISGTIQDSDNPLFPNGTKYISYLIKSPSGVVFHVGYDQRPDWQDKVEIFEKMVRSVKF